MKTGDSTDIVGGKEFSISENRKTRQSPDHGQVTSGDVRLGKKPLHKQPFSLLRRESGIP
jgi:hypothetical protein